MQIEIAEFKESDRDALSRLYVEVSKATFTWLNPERLKANFTEDTLGEYILVAKAAGKVVGFVSAWLPDNFIHHLYVHNAHQNKGIGTKLLKRITAKLNYPMRLKCLTDNTGAIQFYCNRGWTKNLEHTLPQQDYVLFELNT